MKRKRTLRPAKHKAVRKPRKGYTLLSGKGTKKKRNKKRR